MTTRMDCEEGQDGTKLIEPVQAIMQPIAEAAYASFRT